ncbi:hypothetical protein EBB07_28490 [Paenibacillaceae bacterium]|nr:hypothetical protein EBB07_28490 [Paenibacillaceae bacterium]
MVHSCKCGRDIHWSETECDICQEDTVNKPVEVDEPEDVKFIANLKRMIKTANKMAEKQGYIHGQIELGAIERVMNAHSIISIPPGIERVIGAYYERLTGRKAYY